MNFEFLKKKKIYQAAYKNRNRIFFQDTIKVLRYGYQILMRYLTTFWNGKCLRSRLVSNNPHYPKKIVNFTI